MVMQAHSICGCFVDEQRLLKHDHIILSHAKAVHVTRTVFAPTRQFGNFLTIGIMIELQHRVVEPGTIVARSKVP